MINANSLNNVIYLSISSIGSCRGCVLADKEGASCAYPEMLTECHIGGIYKLRESASMTMLQNEILKLKIEEAHG